MKSRLYLVFLVIIFFLVSCNHSEIDLSLIPIKTNGKWGFINKNGEIIINPQFTFVDYFVDDLALVKTLDYKIGYINRKGVFEIQPTFLDASSFNEGLACVVEENKAPAYITSKGKVKFEIKDADLARNFFEDRAAVLIDKKWGFINKSGEIVINPQFDYVYDFRDGLCLVAVKKENMNDYSYGFIDKEGIFVINPQFEDASSFDHGNAVVSIDGKNYGYIDKKGNITINPQFEYCEKFIDKKALIKQNSKFGFIDHKGKIIVNPQFESATYIGKGSLITIRSGNKWGYVNTDGKYKINPQFEDASPFFDGVAIVEMGNKIGLINKKGKIIVNPQFEQFKKKELVSLMLRGFTDNAVKSIESEYFNPSPLIISILSNEKLINFDNKKTLSDVRKDYRFNVDNLHGKYVDVTYNFKFDSINTKDVDIVALNLVFNNEAWEYYTYKKSYYSGYGYYRRRRTQTVSEKTYNSDAILIGKKIDFSLKNRGYGKEKIFADTLSQYFGNNYSLSIVPQKSDKKTIELSNDSVTLKISYEYDNKVSLEITKKHAAYRAAEQYVDALFYKKDYELTKKYWIYYQIGDYNKKTVTTFNSELGEGETKADFDSLIIGFNPNMQFTGITELEFDDDEIEINSKDIPVNFCEAELSFYYHGEEDSWDIILMQINEAIKKEMPFLENDIGEWIIIED